MIRRLRKMNLSKKMILLYTGMVIALIMVLAVSLFFYFRKIVGQFTRESLYSVVNANAQSLEMFLDSIDKAVDMMVPDYVVNESGDNPLQGYYVVRLLRGYGDDPTGRKLVKQFGIYREAQIMMTDYFDICLGKEYHKYSCALFADGQYEFVRFFADFVSWEKQSNSFEFYKQDEVEERDWYKAITARDGEVTWFVMPGEKDAVYMGKLLKYRYIDRGLKEKEENIGVLVCKIGLGWLEEQILKPAFSDEGKVFLMDSQGQILYSSDETVKRELKAVLEQAAVGTVNSCSYENFGYLLQMEELSLGIKFVVMEPESIVTDKVWNTIYIIFIVASIMIAIGIGMICLISVGLVRPIRKLCTHMEAGKPEEISEYGDVCEEIGLLYQGFNELMRRIRQLIENIYLAEEKKKQAELSALQAQINPHFLYNTLDSINCLALMDGEDDIADLLTSLSDILRYSLKKAYDLVPLSKEIEIVECYARIQKNCYENKLQICIDVDREAEAVLVPKLLIQPLIENAIVHGMEEGEKVEIIKVTAWLEENGVHIWVWDNGTHADLDRISQYLSGDRVSRPEEGGLGIYNVAERLRMMYGEEGYLSYNRDEEGCTLARIWIPAGRNGGESGGK